MAALPKSAVVGVVGAGAMGGGIAQVAAAAGHEVLLLDSRSGAAEGAKEKIASGLAKLVEKGKISSEEREGILEGIRPCSELRELARCGLVIEAIVEDLHEKQVLFRAVADLVDESALVATNTSSLSVTALGSVVKNPSRFGGLHFFNPAPIMPLVEVVKGLQTSSETEQSLFDTMLAWGKSPVRVSNSPGFIVNRCARAFYNEPLRFLEEGGADVATIDAIFRGNGFKMGPFELIDFVGLDINLAASRSVWEASYYEPRFRPSRLVQERVEAGMLGRKAGKGFYDYSETGTKNDGQGTRDKGQGSAAKPLWSAGACSRFETPGYGSSPNILPRTEFRGTIKSYPRVGPAKRLEYAWKEAGIPVEIDNGPGLYSFDVNGVTVRLTSMFEHYAPVKEIVFFDMAEDYSKCKHIAISASPQTSPEQIRRAASAFQALGMEVSLVKNCPSLLISRTMSMVANEAADIKGQGLATSEDIDLAMKRGLNFPHGPFEWIESVSSLYTKLSLVVLARAYGHDRYRTSIELDEMVDPSDLHL